ncbi:MAG: peptidyl-prolyl cis-trans isomerase [Meiothermus sp.]|uniref:peptidylprolyl isomerase n=2 Tax=Meiothermus hypogaeus TaxID=884155 RepID=A0A511QZE5_9DEIN|nr:peptidylprolyl isomerase [Meiothermus hypogaeus]RIH79435.1 FKBP-type peptidyl-prolyl cis-trans isomerase SlyD [Meiothermus hypogaeus]GEM82744.1 peptidyl-prolyl cis-trans isomerase [Meiothermus hypogaeus NBRC 106114]GIW38049.1 MAG: peptidyl-prolyl cis-trans isomerase [Meiothermus sp.]
MQIKSYQVIRFEYQLIIDGQVVDRSPEGHPLTILTHFAPNLPAGLEHALLGKQPGAYRVVLPPEAAYGPYDPTKRVVVPRGDLPEEPRLGGAFTAEGVDGQALLYRVVAVEGDSVTLEANHPWAGKTLEYRVVIHAVRPAEKEEVAHGHVHGEGGVVHSPRPE